MLEALLTALTDDIRQPKYRSRPGLAGHCYVASEAWHHLHPGQFTPHQLHHEGESHWYLVAKQTGEVVDLTASQFDTTPDYSQGRGRGFLTRQPSKRAQIVLDRMRGN